MCEKQTANHQLENLGGRGFLCLEAENLKLHCVKRSMRNISDIRRILCQVTCSLTKTLTEKNDHTIQLTAPLQPIIQNHAIILRFLRVRFKNFGFSIFTKLDCLVQCLLSFLFVVKIEFFTSQLIWRVILTCICLEAGKKDWGKEKLKTIPRFQKDSGLGSRCKEKSHLLGCDLIISN